MEVQNNLLVSIGVPVYNGEKELARALDSLLAQDYPNLEIIISDNHSTDSTPEICQQYVQKDPRIKYYRSENNYGSFWNFNRVFELSSGEYFMWAAHDDRRDLSFVSSCLEKLEQCPDAVLCQTHTAIYIEGGQKLLCVANLDGIEGIAGLVQRYRETLKRVPAIALYGLYRSSAMRKTLLLQKVISSDIAFLQELSIYGGFVQVSKTLFNYFGREKWNTIHQDYQSAVGKKIKPWWHVPFVILFSNHCKRVTRASIPFPIKLCLWGVLTQHEIGQFFLRSIIKISGCLCPGKWKEKLGLTIYWKWMNSCNLKAECEDLFLERVIKPRLGWWR